MSALCQKQTWARLTQSPHRRWKAISVVCLLAEWRRANQVPMIRIAPQHQLISFVVERLRVPWRSEPAAVARPFIIAIAIDHGATRSQEAAVVEWPSSRNSVAHQRCLRCIECVAMSALCQKQTFRLLLDIIVGGQGCSSSWSITRETSPSPILASDRSRRRVTDRIEGCWGRDLSVALDHDACRISTRRPDRHAGTYPQRSDATFAWWPKRSCRNGQRCQWYDCNWSCRPRQPGRLHHRNRQLGEQCRRARDLPAQLRCLQGPSANLASRRLPALDS